MRNVAYSTLTAGSKKQFAYFTEYSNIGLIYCHCFESSSATTIVAAMRDAAASAPEPHTYPTKETAPGAIQRKTGVTIGT